MRISALRHIGVIVLLNLRHLPQRLGSSLVTVVGIAGVVGVSISVLAMASGLLKTFVGTGRSDRAIVVAMSALSEAGSSLSRDAALTIMTVPGVNRSSDGAPIASAEAVMLVPGVSRSSGRAVNITVRGIGPSAFALRPEIRLVEGRMFRAGLHEVIVGRAAQMQFEGLEIGDRIHMFGDDWAVVGTFASSVGGTHDSELFADSETVLSAGRRNEFQSVTVMLQSPDAFAGLVSALTRNPLLSVEAQRESEYFATQSKPLSRVLFATAYGVGGIMAVGALFSALNTMYSAVESRTREIATLRAIGFGGDAVVISVLVEALLLAFVGASIGALFAVLAFNGRMSSTIGGGGAQLVYSFAIGPWLVAIGIVCACAIGLVGGLFPAVRAARLSVAAALRAV